MKKVLPLLIIICFLCGCKEPAHIPYTTIQDNVYACGDYVWDHGNIRQRTVADKQALQFVNDDKGIELSAGELAYYNGTLYSLSNYRTLLLGSGYSTEQLTRTCDVLDTTLSNGAGRVRLIYQASGRIRILFENSTEAAHILVEGI